MEISIWKFLLELYSSTHGDTQQYANTPRVKDNSEILLDVSHHPSHGSE
jgi:hypothetical protein